MLADAPGAWQVDATAEHRTLVERDASGARLLKESGPLARLRIVARPSWAAARRLEFSASLAHARLDYEGRTQSGAALATVSRHDEIAAGVRWTPWSSPSWGEAAFTFDGLRWRRAIAGSAAISPLTETSTVWMPGLAWTSPDFSAGGARFNLRAAWRTSVDHRLHVDYSCVFDPSSLQGGRRSDIALGVRASWDGGWSVSLDASHVGQAASASVPLYRVGAVSGTVRQPHISIDDVGLTLSRSF